MYTKTPSGGQRWGVMVVFNLEGLDVSWKCLVLLQELLSSPISYHNTFTLLNLDNY